MEKVLKTIRWMVKRLKNCLLLWKIFNKLLKYLSPESLGSCDHKR
jgi:hypothetical protein